MKIFNNIRNFIGEDNFRIILYNDKVDIVNYSNIKEISDDKLIIESNKSIIISGKNLRVSKLLNNEALIYGDINNIKIDE